MKRVAIHISYASLIFIAQIFNMTVPISEKDYLFKIKNAHILIYSNRISFQEKGIILIIIIVFQKRAIFCSRELG